MSTVLTRISRRQFGIIEDSTNPFNVSYINHLANSYHAPWPMQITAQRYFALITPRTQKQHYADVDMVSEPPVSFERASARNISHKYVLAN